MRKEFQCINLDNDNLTEVGKQTLAVIVVENVSLLIFQRRLQQMKHSCREHNSDAHGIKQQTNKYNLGFVIITN